MQQTTSGDSGGTPPQQPTSQVEFESISDVGVIRLGAPDESVVVLNESRMASLTAVLESLKGEKALKGIVIAGAHHNLFCAGADINVIKDVRDPEVGYKLAKQGQDIFALLEELPMTTVAAISGACVGGGCELALACDYRILADNDSTKIGLPETKLGIIPGFGGTQRLPKLIGIRPALDTILKGRVSPAKIALKIGLADKLVKGGEEELLKVACEVASGRLSLSNKGPGFVDKILASNSLGRSIVEKAVNKSLRKTAKHYPAPSKALEAVLMGYEEDAKSAYEFEARALGEMIITDECKSLVHLFFLTQDAQRIGASAKKEVEDAHLSVIGAGTMGAGIAGSFLLSGYKVTLADTAEAARNKAKDRISKIINKKRSFSEAKKTKCLESLGLTGDLGQFSSADLVIEAIVEDLEIKQKVLASVEEIVSSDCIIATNTSSLSVSDMSEGMSNSERLIGLHFFNPAEKMQLVELVCGDKTSDATIAWSAALISSLGKYPVVVKDVPGFLVNRTLTPYLVEAAYLLSEGFSVSEIDKAAKNFGMPMGPFQLLDEIGLDIAAKVSQIMETKYGIRMQGPKHAEELTAKNLFGKKSGKGFYIHEGKKRSVNSEVPELLGLSDVKPKETKLEELEKRLIYPFVNEAIRSLDEGVCGLPGKEAACQIDLASVFGTGFAPFRGGIIKYAETVGAKELNDTLSAYSKKYGERYQPAPGIEKRATNAGSFYSAAD